MRRLILSVTYSTICEFVPYEFHGAKYPLHSLHDLEDVFLFTCYLQVINMLDEVLISFVGWLELNR